MLTTGYLEHLSFSPLACLGKGALIQSGDRRGDQLAALGLREWLEKPEHTGACLTIRGSRAEGEVGIFYERLFLKSAG